MPSEAKLSPVFRESFLALLVTPEEEARMRRAGELGNELAREGKTPLAVPGRAPIDWTTRKVRGAIGDLRQAIAFLANLGDWIEEADLNPEQSRLMLVVADTATELEPFADRLEAGIASYLAARLAPDE
jgi:hypothetical protein